MEVALIKSGLYQIVAAGEVVERNGKSTGCEDKSWLRDFDGWDLPAYCCVDWHVPDKPIKNQWAHKSNHTKASSRQA